MTTWFITEVQKEIPEVTAILEYIDSVVLPSCNVTRAYYARGINTPEDMTDVSFASLGPSNQE